MRRFIASRNSDHIGMCIFVLLMLPCILGEQVAGARPDSIHIFGWNQRRAVGRHRWVSPWHWMSLTPSWDSFPYCHLFKNEVLFTVSRNNQLNKLLRW